MDEEVETMAPEKVYAMPFAKVYPLLVQKAERKGRTREEVDTVTCWLTGYQPADLERLLSTDADYRAFFAGAPRRNPNAEKIKGSICGVRVEEIADPLMRQIRQLDKLVDELAKRKPMEKILRT